MASPPRRAGTQRRRVDKVKPKRTFWLAPGVGKVREEGERLEELAAYVPGTT